METVRIRTPQSLLQLLPRIVGRTDAPALVALPFAAGRSGMPMVLDLPEPGSSAALAKAIATGAGGCDAVVLVACFDEPLGSGPLPLAVEMRLIAERLARGKVRPLELLALAPDAWGDYAAPHAARGPLAELDLLDDPAPGVPLPRPIPGVPDAVDGAASMRVAQWLWSLDPVEMHAANAAPIEALELAVTQAANLGDGPQGLGVDPAKAAAVAIALVLHPAMRDLAIELAIDGVEAGAATLAAIDDPDALVGEAAGERFLGRGAAPDAERLHERLWDWSAIAEATPLQLRAPLLVICGFLHFFVGRGRTAARCAELAMATDPQLTMAPLLRDIVDARGAPDWVLHERDPRVRVGGGR